MTFQKRYIQFGILCDSTHLYTWQETVIKKLVAECDVELKLVVFEKAGQIDTYPISLQNSYSRIGFLWNLFYRHKVKKKSKALKKVETGRLFKDIPKIHCNFITVDRLTQLEAADIEKIKDAGLDFMLNFASVQFSGTILNTAAYGIWSFWFGELGKYDGPTPCFWEIYHKDLLSSAYLIRVTDGSDLTSVLREGHLKTDILYHKNLDNIHFETTGWPLKLCHDIRTGQAGNFTNTRNIKLGRQISCPSNLQLLNFFGIQLSQGLKKAYNLIFYTDYWNIGIVFSPIQEFLDTEKKPVVQWFPNLVKSHFMADPFGILFKGKLYVLYEDFRFDQGLGKTASFLVDNGKFMENKIVIAEKFHMSYPFILEYENNIYCIPETHQANQVRLYRATDFPKKWKLEKVLIENYAGIDSTLFEYNDTWFLFSSNKNSGHRYNLNIHYSNSIFGPWREHPKNPVKTDIRSARPAGTMFIHNGEIFRPSMDYSEKIEGRITLNKISTLTIDDFEEEFHNIVHPFKNAYYSDKVHTLSQIGSYTLVDGAKELFILSNFNVFRYKISRILKKLKNN
ncbi:hypothetical protein SAMN05421636_102333 [Pricia antarctica]|uniref:Glucosamine inositolphosphorylceramide transferase 1 N-terminal domain-containing protein n=1 Tax=Pricia antarctica TaxID=641691 RepID=A0A1G6YRY5_9FLAO|nr:hypothetical protein [Pricia antarctica]SDD92427.1 hypothetical protein SAMN05421636_102333 [Pricia antarctica]